MHILITAGPTREPIDEVRFISNASSGRMGCAVAEAAIHAGHDVTLLHGPMTQSPPAGARLLPFQTVTELRDAMAEQFPRCDAVVMTAAVGDFRLAHRRDGKLSRKDGPIQLELIPTEDVIAGIAAGKRPGQQVVVFAVEAGPREDMERKAREELQSKHADMVVLNPPAAMGRPESEAAILSATDILLPWARRPKSQLAEEIIRLLCS
jgi:phosphopantothenoylcysteine decarboxylase/phosphopantothenate--cysteine ligase